MPVGRCRSSILSLMMICSYFPSSSPPSFFRGERKCLSFSLLLFAGTECSVSMDSVLRKRSQGKLEHRVVPLHEVLPPPRRLSAPIVALPQLMESSSTTGDQPALEVSLSPALIPRPSGEPLTEDVVDSKDWMISNVLHFEEKRKAT